MLRKRYLPIAILLLWPLSASAQPIFHTKRDWTITIADQHFGIYDIVQNPGEICRTEIFVGPWRFYSYTPIAAAVTTLLGPPVDLLRVAFRPPPKQRKVLSPK